MERALGQEVRAAQRGSDWAGAEPPAAWGLPTFLLEGPGFWSPRSLSGHAGSGSGFRAVAHPAAETPVRGVFRVNGYLVARQDSWPFLESQSLPSPSASACSGPQAPRMGRKSVPRPMAFTEASQLAGHTSCLTRLVLPEGRCGSTCSLAPSAAEDGLGGRRMNRTLSLPRWLLAQQFN